METIGRWLTVLLLGGSLAACRDGGGDDDDNGADAGGDDESIYAIQDGTLADGAIVNVRGVVVVAIDAYGMDRGGFWVAEPDEHPTHGRAYSGVQVFTSDLTLVGSLAVGDLVDVEGGEVDEFNFNCIANPSLPECTDDLQTLTEIKFPTAVTVVGAGQVPAPAVVTPWELAADDAESEKWESVLVRFDDVAVTQGLRTVGTTDPLLEEMRVTGPYLVQSALADLGAVARDDCYTSITGLGNWFFDYKLLPRSAADLVKAADTSACVYETQAADCDDGADNDHDGFGDCQDFSCQTENPLLCAITVVDIQGDQISLGAPVAVAGVVVTAVTGDGKTLWIQDAGSTADYSGISVYRGVAPPALDTAIGVGSTVNVSGEKDDYMNETQVAVFPSSADVTWVSDGASVSIRNDVPLATLADLTVGEPYEGMLVELTNVGVVNPNAGFGSFTVGTAGQELIVDNFIHNFTLPGAGTCYTTLRGVMAEYQGARRMYPRAAEDMITGGGCL